jgi:hypothetical protein
MVCLGIKKNELPIVIDSLIAAVQRDFNVAEFREPGYDA